MVAMSIVISVSRKRGKNSNYNMCAYVLASQRDGKIYTHWDCEKTDHAASFVAKAILRLCNECEIRNIKRNFELKVNYATPLEDGLNYERSLIEMKGRLGKDKPLKKDSEIWRDLYHSTNSIGSFSISDIKGFPKEETVITAKKMSVGKASEFANSAYDADANWSDSNSFDWLDVNE